MRRQKNALTYLYDRRYRLIPVDHEITIRLTGRIPRHAAGIYEENAFLFPCKRLVRMPEQRDVAQLFFRRAHESVRAAFDAVAMPVAGEDPPPFDVEHEFALPAEKVVIARNDVCLFGIGAHKVFRVGSHIAEMHDVIAFGKHGRDLIERREVAVRIGDHDERLHALPSFNFAARAESAFALCDTAFFSSADAMPKHFSSSSL